MELIVVEKLNAVEVFTGPQGVDKILADIESQVKAFEPDTTTAKGRKEIASLAYKVSQSKVVLDDLGKDLVAEWKKKSAQVDASRKIARDRLDALRDEARKPLTQWEEAEAARLEAEKLAREIEEAHSVALAEHALWIKAQELAAREAEIARQEAERKAREEAEEKSRREAEEAKRLQELEAQRERERAEAEARRVKEAEERARKEAEEAAERAILEAQRREAEAKAAAEKAEREKIEASERAKIEQERAVKEAEERAKAESSRVERERLAKEAADRAEAARKAADIEHRRAINREALSSLSALGLDEATAKNLIVSIAAGQVKHVSIKY